MEQDLKYNWLTLMLCVLKKCTIEQAFQQMEEGDIKRRYRKHWTADELKEIAMYRDMGMTNREIGEMFGVGPVRISRIYNAEKKKLCSEEQ